MIYEPNEYGYWGDYGGRFVPETLVAPLDELTSGYFAVRDDPDFQAEFDDLLQNYVGRPNPLYYAKRLSEIGHLPVALAKQAIDARLIDYSDVVEGIGLSITLQERAYSLATRRFLAALS